MAPVHGPCFAVSQCQLFTLIFNQQRPPYTPTFIPLFPYWGVTSFTRSHERKSRGFVWVRPKHAGIIYGNHGKPKSKPLWASDLLSVGIHYFAGVVWDSYKSFASRKSKLGAVRRRFLSWV